jgi:hypothetical protein
MSSPLAIAAVTAALKDLLNDGLLNHDLSSVGSFTVTALPPDRVTTGQNEANQLNLFLYRVTPNPGWRNQDLPTRNANGELVHNSLLALDLHYLLTAYGAQDLNAEILLGYAMNLLNETQVFTRANLRTVLGAPSPVDGTILPSPFGDLSAADLADQVEPIKISPVYLNTEDLSKMWTAMQARYRPTMAYMVSVVLIEGTESTSVAPPVLTRGPQDCGPVAVGAPFPTLTGAHTAVSEFFPAARLGDDIVVSGTNLAGNANLTAVFEHGETGAQVELNPLPDAMSGELRLHIPSVAEDATAMISWSAGLYSLSMRVEKPGLPLWTTNSVPLALAPLIEIDSLTASPGDVPLTVRCTPRLHAEQEAHVSLIFGDRSVYPENISQPGDPTLPSELEFTVPSVSAGEYLVRLRVRGVDSLAVILDGDPPVLTFDPQQKVQVS